MGTQIQRSVLALQWFRFCDLFFMARQDYSNVATNGPFCNMTKITCRSRTCWGRLPTWALHMLKLSFCPPTVSSYIPKQNALPSHIVTSLYVLAEMFYYSNWSNTKSQIQRPPLLFFTSPKVWELTDSFCDRQWTMHRVKGFIGIFGVTRAAVFGTRWGILND